MVVRDIIGGEGGLSGGKGIGDWRGKGGRDGKLAEKLKVKEEP